MNSAEHKKRIAEMTQTLRYMEPDDFGKYWENYETQVIEAIKLIKD